MKNFYISKFSVKKLWGHKNYPLAFNDDVNIIIGPNASGKTTLINILFNSLNGHFARLFGIDFAEVVINLKEFNGTGKHMLKFVKGERGLTVQINRQTPISIAVVRRFRDEGFHTRESIHELRLQHRLKELVPAVWLPVSRELPISEREWEREWERRMYHHRKPSESVDNRLSDLVEKLQQYRISLNAELSEFRKKFQQNALKNILYDKRLDSIKGWDTFVDSTDLPLEYGETALLDAFSGVGLSGSDVKGRITEHLSAANNAITRFRKSDGQIDAKMLFIIPLISRTQSIVEFAQKLERQQKELFSALRSFESVVDSFLHEKTVEVSDHGKLTISSKHSNESIDLQQLSSGEKQILILLTQALLSRKNPAVYVADEPELSLHIEWQEKLLISLDKLSGKCQFIVATHSPDIVSRFGEKVIDLDRLQ